VKNVLNVIKCGKTSTIGQKTAINVQNAAKPGITSITG